jgi:chromosome segregation ATPase
MSKASAGDWKTPLGYYEMAIAELKRTCEEIRTERQNFKEISQIGLQTLKAELLNSYSAELQALKAELQATKAHLETTQQTANEALARVATVESAANTAQEEIQTLKAELQAIKDCVENTQQTAFETQAKLVEAERTANADQIELQALNAEFQTAQNDIKTIYKIAADLPIEELIWLKQNIGSIKHVLGMFGRK